MTDFIRPTKAEAKEIVKGLTQKYFKFEDTYKTWNEAQIRADLINPFFKALGWNIDNIGLDPDEREVVVETSVKVFDELSNKDQAVKHPDYGFYHKSSQAKFYVEAKHPKENLSSNPKPAFQLRRYAYSDRLPVSIITDFEEFVVYDCTVQPLFADKNIRGFQLKYLTYHSYVKEFDFLWEHFSYEAVEQGRFDAFAKKDTKRRGASSLDLDFVQSLDQWRELLARDIFQNNPNINTNDLNFAVQNILDRIIFLRVCEDRDIEPYEQLKGVFQSKGKFYQNLVKDFERAALRYNSDLFNFNRDTITPTLNISDKAIEGIINDLYVPNSPYVFKIIPVEILGNAYERFLGKTITVNTRHQIVIEEKPEVRKAGGVFYTPQYIVNYIVQNTVGRLVEGKTPEFVAELRILDPSCGSGSFLIGTYQFLLDWHIQYYKQNKKKYATTKLKPFRSDGSLTNAERKRILLNNIYGVDLDPQAVEVAKLSLLLKALEGETAESVKQLVSAFERVLPSLDENIRCGNSLISNDLKKVTPSVSKAEEADINPFEWETAFKKVFDAGGFDCVIGNPPYVVLEGEFRNDVQLSYFKEKYYSASYKIDLYHLFFEHSIKILKDNGLLGFITPSNYLSNNGLVKLREFILKNSQIVELNVIEGKVFIGASVDTTITLLEKSSSRKFATYVKSKWQENQLIELSSKVFQQSIFDQSNEKLFIATEQRRVSNNTFELGERYNVKFGMQLRDRKIYEADVITTDQKHLKNKYHRPCYTGKNISRYNLDYSNLLAYFNREAKSGGCWDEKVHNAKPKILVRQIGEHPICCLDDKGYCCLNTLFMVVPKLEEEELSIKYVLGILNSDYIKKYWENNFSDQRKTFPKIKGSYLEQLPIRKIDFKNSTEKKKHNELVSLVELVLNLKADITFASLRDRERLVKKVQDTEGSINALVYGLYDLTASEIALIEGV